MTTEEKKEYAKEYADRVKFALSLGMEIFDARIPDSTLVAGALIAGAILYHEYSMTVIKNDLTNGGDYLNVNAYTS